MEDIAKYVERLIVMNRGEVVFDDTPKAVFSHYKELEEMGLAAPQITYIMNDLKKNGFRRRYRCNYGGGGEREHFKSS